jgi:hypothetical protein
MSWITNLFKKKPKRLPARDGIGRFLADDKGNQLFTDSPIEEIEKAKAKLLKKDEDLIKYFNTIRISKTTYPVSTEKKCACGGDCGCAPKPVAKKTAQKTAKAPVAKKPVAKKATSTTAKKATPKKK